MIPTPNYPLLLFISPYRQNLIHISIFLQKTLCGQRPMDIFGGKKSLDSFENWTGGPQHMPIQCITTIGCAHQHFFCQKKIQKRAFCRGTRAAYLTKCLYAFEHGNMVRSCHCRLQLYISPYLQNLIHISNLLQKTLFGQRPPPSLVCRLTLPI